MKVFDNSDVKEADVTFDAKTCDGYINMELVLDRGDDGPEFARVKKRLKDNEG